MQCSLATRLAIAPLILVSLAATAWAVRPVEGPVIKARANASETLYLWDATTYVIHRRRDGIVSFAGLHALEGSALLSLQGRARGASSRNVVLSVLYQRTGAVDPAYGNPTFAGVEKVFTMRASRLDVMKHANEWERALGQGSTPAKLQITMTGRLPPAPGNPQQPTPTPR